MRKPITVDLTAFEALSIAYALEEIANRRQEQAIDYPGNAKTLRMEADEHRALADKLRQAMKGTC